MSPTTRAAFLAICILIAQTIWAEALWAKGVTVRIEIDGAALADTLTITDPSVIEEFSIWSGPNSGWVRDDGSVQPDYSGTFIDFPRGAIGAPADELLQFEVRFYIGRERGAEPLDRVYTVRYALDPSSPGGYMYLPQGNSLIWHGVEGNWFRSTEQWETLVRPVVDTAIGTSAGRR